MVSYSDIKAANAKTVSSLPSGLVAVFVGGTNGIGEATLRRFAKETKQPRVYLVGRSKDAGDRITADLKSSNSSGEFTFIQADVSLMKNVDEVCQTIKKKEQSINLLFLTTGTLNMTKETEEGLNFAAALTLFSRTRFTLNLLPLLQNAPGLRRVVSTFVASNEGALDVTNIQAKGMGMMPARAHNASAMTLSMEKLSEQAPTVSFIHDFPGVVGGTGIFKDTGSGVMWAMGKVVGALSPLIGMSLEESGQRHFYLATSDSFPAGSDSEKSSGKLARGTNGQPGSGVYSINEKCESSSPEVEKTLAGLRKEGAADKVLEGLEVEYERIVGPAKL